MKCIFYFTAPKVVFAKHTGNIIQSNHSLVKVFLDAGKSIVNPKPRKEGEELFKFINQQIT